MSWTISGTINLSPVGDGTGSAITIDLPVDQRTYLTLKQIGDGTPVAGPATVAIYEVTDDSAIMVDWAYCIITPLEGSDDFFVGVYIDRNGADQLAFGYDADAGGLPVIIRGNQYNALDAGLTNAIAYGTGPPDTVSRVEIRVPAGSTAKYVATFLRE